MSKKITLRNRGNSNFWKRVPSLGLKEQREQREKLRNLERGPWGAETQTSEEETPDCWPLVSVRGWGEDEAGSTSAGKIANWSQRWPQKGMTSTGVKNVWPK